MWCPAAAAQDEAGRQALVEEADAVLDPRYRRLTELATESAAAAQDHDEGLGPDVLGNEEGPGEHGRNRRRPSRAAAPLIPSSARSTR